MKTSASPAILLAAALLGACGGGGNGPTTTAFNCNGIGTTTLAVGAVAVINPAQTAGCLRLPAAGAGGAEYVIAAVSGAGQQAPSGVSGSYTLQAATDTFAPFPAPLALARLTRPSHAEAFHAMLRAREAAIARSPGVHLGAASVPALRAVPPVVGTQRSFKVCRTDQCTSFVSVTATAKHVGSRGAVYLDNTTPAGGYTQADLDSIGVLFDKELYGIDTTAFGRESDLDGNGVVIALLTPKINALSPNCSSSSSGVILGYFFGLDLDLTDPNSNRGEVFYSLVPDPANSGCRITLSFARDRLAPTFIHEFQHMISFNRHVLLGGGGAEETWLNEGLSHFAEELGGRLVPNGYCTINNCLDQFARGDLLNAYDYLTSPERFFLVAPGSSVGTLAERGADWLFVRWLADQDPADSVLGGQVTRLLDGANGPGGIGLSGSANVTTTLGALGRPGVSFATLAAEWQLTIGLSDNPAFIDQVGTLHYRSWDFPAAFNQLALGPYPLTPDSTSGHSYSAAGTLRGGSGHHLRVVQPAAGAGVAIFLTTGNTVSLAPRLGIVRVR